ncbi:MAG: ATP-dependent helicase [Acidimicrobiales bacterium]
MVTPRRAAHPEDLLAGCDAQQKEAITTTAQPLCVLAGAGSGKTRVLSRRVAWRVLDGSALSTHVLMLTFTRKAAAEMRSRLGLLGLPETVTAGTFHAMALAELRRLARERGQAPPVVMSSKARLIQAVMSNRPGRHSGRGGNGRPDRKGFPVHAIAAEIEWAKARLMGPLEYLRLAPGAGREPPLAFSEIAGIYEAYEDERRRRRVLDFEDLLTVCASEIASDAEFAASARWRFRHVFVDEYQDVNAAQLTLLKRWCAGSDDLCVVGDPDQAIYGWNGSDPGAISRFPEDFPGSSVIRLRANYRSTAEVLGVAAAVLGLSEVLPANGPGAEGPIPTVVSYASGEEEAAGVADRARLAHRPGRRWSQIAVLTRTNAQLPAFREAFSKLRIPVRVVGENDFLRRPHVAAAIGDLAQARNQSALAAIAQDLRLTGEPERELGEAQTLGGSLTSNERQDLAELATLVEEYLSADLVASGEGFREFVEASAPSLGTGSSNDAVELMTFHRAKGLEWPVVFVTGLEEGLVPVSHARDEGALAEERRLLYVACTRAEQELHLSWARERRFAPSRASQREPSVFLIDIDRARHRLEKASASTMSSAREALAASRLALARSQVH